MISQLKLTKSDVQDYDTLHIGANRNRIRGHINVLRFQDVDTKQIVIFVPSLGISSYGETEDKAREMLNVEIQTFFNYLLDISQSKLMSTLAELGFKQDKNRHKDFSKVVVDIEGNLQNFNIEKGTVQRYALVA